LPGQALVLVDVHPCVEREVRADAQEHATPVCVADVEVVLPDKAADDFDAIAASRRRVADGDARILAALEDDGDAKVRAQRLIEGLDPILSADVLGRLDNLHTLGKGYLTDPAVIVLRHSPKVGLGNRGHTKTLVQKADDHRRPLHRLNDGVQEHTIEARVLKLDAVQVVLDERIHGGPPYDRFGNSHRRRSVVVCSLLGQHWDFKGSALA